MGSSHEISHRADVWFLKSFASSAARTDQVYVAGLVGVMVGHAFLKMSLGEDV